MTIRDDILAAAKTRQGMPYQIDPPPDGINTIDCSLGEVRARLKARVWYP